MQIEADHFIISSSWGQALNPIEVFDYGLFFFFLFSFFFKIIFFLLRMKVESHWIIYRKWAAFELVRICRGPVIW